MDLRISVVIPAYNEQAALPLLLGDLAEARRRYSGGPAAVEVVVADNGSTDGTVRIAESAGCRTVHVERRIIAAVRNGGASVATGEILAFIDADTRVHPETFNAIEEYFADGTRVVGASGILPERRSLGIDLGWYALGGFVIAARYGLPRRRWELVPAGVVACRRADFEVVGGYQERYRFAEDVRLLLDLRKLGSRRRQRCGWFRDVPAVTSTRKFDAHGDWHYITAPWKVAAQMVLSRRALDRFADRYWYGTQRQAP